MNDNPLTRVLTSAPLQAPVATPAPPNMDAVLKSAGYAVARSAGGASGVPHSTIIAPQAAAHIDPAGTAAAIDAIARTEVPATPAEYQMPERGPLDAPLSVPEVQQLQSVAHAVGLTSGEFKTIVLAGRLHAQRTGGASMTHAERELAGSRMEAELIQFHGDDPSVTLCEKAMAVVRATKARDPALGEALHDMILTSRPLLEMMARVGRRTAGRR